MTRLILREDSSQGLVLPGLVGTLRVHFMETILNPTVIPQFPKPYAKWKAALLKLEPNQYLRVSGEWKDNTLRQACRRASIGGRRYRLHKEGTEVQLWRLQ